MALVYDVTSTPNVFLSAEALADSARLAAHNELAEIVWGLAGKTAISAEPTASTVKYAVVIQINYQVERGVDPTVYTSRSDKGRSRSFIDNGLRSPDAGTLLLSVGLVEGPYGAIPAVRSLRNNVV